ncbi:hypothetical protein [Lancefieldella rimae]|uniref:hypothetical protein n=1 Tax=Lancefieldella rimae TaxID=1383 RepID=UPI003C703187
MAVPVKRKGFIVLVGVLVFGSTVLAMTTSKESNRNNDEHSVFAYKVHLTGYIVSIDEEANTFQLRVPVEDGSERVLTVHFGEKPVSGVLVNVSDYKIGDRVTIDYFPYDRKGSYIDADFIEIFDGRRDRVWKDAQVPKIYTDKNA